LFVNQNRSSPADHTRGYIINLLDVPRRQPSIVILPS
jgi:hypothetical protein